MGVTINWCFIVFRDLLNFSKHRTVKRKESGIMAEEKKTAVVKPIAKAAVKVEAAKEEKKA